MTLNACAEKILASIEKQASRPSYSPRDIHELNKVIMGAFDNRPHAKTQTRSWARIASDQIWCEQVRAQLRAIGCEDQFEDALHTKI